LHWSSFMFLWCFFKIFPLVFSLFLNDDTHIINLAFVIFHIFQHFLFNSHMWGLWSSFANAQFSCLLGCLLNFLFLPIYYYLLDGIKVLGILFGSTSFNFSFLQNKLDKDVCHVDAFSRLRDVQIAFGIPFQCFPCRPL
jgi:hypothetical protein